MDAHSDVLTFLLSMTDHEVAFNKVLHRIWNLPYNSHTRIIHCTARLYYSTYKYSCSCSLLQCALSCSSFPVSLVFHSSSHLAYTFCGSNRMFFSNHVKLYYRENYMCADIITDSRCHRHSCCVFCLILYHNSVHLFWCVCK